MATLSLQVALGQPCFILLKSSRFPSGGAGVEEGMDIGAREVVLFGSSSLNGFPQQSTHLSHLASGGETG